MRWFRRPTPEYITITPPKQRERIAKDVWHKCDNCGAITRNKDWIANWKVCPNCGLHDRLMGPERLELLVDDGTFEELDADLVPQDPLGFSDLKKYEERIGQAREKTGRNDAILAGWGEVCGVRTSLAIMDFSYMGGSMGSVVGERVARAMERAVEEKCPCVTVASTGGARMQEGILSLMQLAKTSILCKRMNDAGTPFISILADPSTAGVMASFASLGDVIIAEPGAYVGFAGKRVIEQTIRQSLPAGFQTAEFVRDHGFVDMVVPRDELKVTLGTLLRQLAGLEPMPVMEEEEPGQTE